MQTSLSYQSLFLELRRYLLAHQPIGTQETTRAIKGFFRGKFGADHIVMSSDAESSEYLADLLVLNFNPKDVLVRRTLDLVPESIRAFVAVESELGGSGASSAYGVMKNVVEDFLKLLLIQSEYKILIFTSLPYSKEVNHVERRVDTLRELYKRASGLNSGALLVHIEGRQVSSTQVQTVVTPVSLRGFVISANGSGVTHIEALVSLPT